MADIKYEIKKELGVISESPKGWKKELNLVSWNGGTPKYDIRDWAPDHEKMGKGITLTKEEAQELYKLLSQIQEKGLKYGRKTGEIVQDKEKRFILEKTEMEDSENRIKSERKLRKTLELERKILEFFSISSFLVYIYK